MPDQLYSKKSECCGCEACANVCPKGIVEMKPDGEGFLYPRIVKPEECINCRRCEKVCPVKNASRVPDFFEKAIAGYSLSQDEIKASASGGLGTALAKGFVNSGGVVYGVAYTNDFLGIEYKRATTIAELELFRTSKYVQSRKEESFSRVKTDLDEGKKVLFIGLPCDDYALQLYLNKYYVNLYVCALICHGPTSPLVHKQFIKQLIEKQKCDVDKFSVRYKKEGWKPYYIRAMFKNGYEYLEKFAESTYGIAFLYMKRPSCNACKIKRSKIHSDITIGDYHLAAGGQFKPYNPYGVSVALIHTEKGECLLSAADNFWTEEIPVKSALYSEAYCRSIPARKNRDEFGKAFSSGGLDAACKLKSIQSIEIKLARSAWLRKQCARVKSFILSKCRLTNWKRMRGRMR